MLIAGDLLISILHLFRDRSFNSTSFFFSITRSSLSTQQLTAQAVLGCGFHVFSMVTAHPATWLQGRASTLEVHRCG